MAHTNNIIKNFFWKFAERISAQLISTVVSIVLARMLEPTDYGLISIVMIFITLANVFVSDGLGSALIQKKDATPIDYFSVLYFNIAFSCVLYVVLFLIAPYISRFYGEGYEILCPILRVLGLRIILTSVNSVQQAYVSKKMIFKKFFVSTLTGTILSAGVGIYMAYCGYGVWALVAQYLVNTTVNTIVLFFTLRKRPKLLFSLNHLKKLLPYGIRVLSTSLLITGYKELQALIIGKKYSSEDLAYYSKGKQFPELLVDNINSSLSAVLFPKMSNEQDNIKNMRYIASQSIRFSSYLIAPMMLGLAAIAKPFVCLVLTEKWINCVPLLQLFCIIYLFYPIHSANMQAVKASGRSDIYLKVETIKKVIEVPVLLISMQFGVTAIVVGMALCATCFTAVNAYPNKKLIGYGFFDQMKDILPNVVLSLVMFVVVYSLRDLPIQDFWMILLQVIIGMLVYIGLSVVTKNPSFRQLIEIIKIKIIGRREKNEI